MQNNGFRASPVLGHETAPIPSSRITFAIAFIREISFNDLLSTSISCFIFSNSVIGFCSGESSSPAPKGFTLILPKVAAGGGR